MNKLLVTIILILSVMTLSTAAEKYDTKALRTVQKLCKSCHGTPFYFAKQSDEDDWKFYFTTKGKLESIHKNDPKGLKNINSSKFKNRKERVLKFMINNSKYSGTVHGCDANFCGTNK